MDTLGIPNAKHWQPSSIVVVKADYTAGDEAAIMNKLVRLDASGAEVTGKHRDIVLIERMVQPGSQVSVLRPGGRIYTVSLPQEAEKLLKHDMEYIARQIDALNEPVMSEEAQADFLPGSADSSPAM